MHGPFVMASDVLQTGTCLTERLCISSVPSPQGLELSDWGRTGSCLGDLGEPQTLIGPRECLRVSQSNRPLAIAGLLPADCVMSWLTQRISIGQLGLS